MRPRFAIGLGALLLGTPALAGCAGSDDPPPEVQIHRLAIDGCGLAPQIATGFSIRDGLLVTVAHALAGDGPITVDGRTASVLALDTRSDLAFVSYGGDGRRVPLFRAPLAGESVTVLRWRDDAVESAAAAVRQATTIRFHDAVEDTVVERAGAVLSLGLIGGDSGAPALGADGKVVGVMFANAKATTESYAVSATEVIDLLDQLREDTATAVRPPC